MPTPSLLSSFAIRPRKTLGLTGDRRCFSIAAGPEIHPYRSRECRIQQLDDIPGRIGNVDRARSVSMCL